MKSKFKIILNMLTLFTTGLLLVALVFGWYVTNKVANVEAGTGLTALNDSITLEDTVIAKIYYLKGDVTTETYQRGANGKLYLIKREFAVAEGEAPATQNYTVSEEKPFFIRSLLPGEYIDITIGYSMDDSFDGANYSVGLMNVNGSGEMTSATNFTLDGKTHYATGAFKWKNISLKSGNITVLQSLTSGTVVNNFSSATYAWVGEYDITKNDETNIRIPTLNHTWDNDYTKLFYTFRIFEDFNQYYDLVAQSASYTGDPLLSFLTLDVGNIYILA
jgi:hypothetical protein